MTEQPAPSTGDDSPDGSAEPPTVWAEIRLDLLVVVLALIALVVNLVSPDALSPALTPVLLIATGWVAYRIFRKVRTFPREATSARDNRNV